MRDRISGVLKSGWIGGLLVAFLAGCATSPTALPIPKPRAVLVAPTTVDTLMPSELRSGAPIVQQMIGQLLWEQDMQVNAPPLPEFYELWREAADTTAAQPLVAGGDVRDAAVRVLLDGLRARGENFDALLVPYLTIRPGTVTGQSVSWDGVARRLPLSYKNHDAAFLVARRGVYASCTSLGVVAYGPHGERLFERIGGLEVAKRMWVSDDGHRRGWNDREDLFQDQKALRSGVAQALQPLLRN
jgi:hypothetical protein